MTKPESETPAKAVPMLSFGGTEIEGFEVKGIHAAVVYGDKSRAVLHVHHAVTLGADKPPSCQDLEARALELARREFERRGIEVGESLAALAVDPDALLSGVEYRVDETGRKLVAINAPQR